MNGLFRTYIDTEPHWSVVGPGHQRLYFNHLDLIGYAAAKEGGFHVYGMNGQHPDQVYKTIPAAKRAARRWLNRLIPFLEEAELVWKAEDTGVHFSATALGYPIANYYKCDQPTGGWHVGFKVWFAGTFYTREFSGHDDACQAVANTWKEWLSLARQHLLPTRP